MGGYAYGNFSGDTSGFGGKALGLYPDGSTFAVSASVVGELNITPNVALRLAPEYLMTGFGSTLQNSLGFTGGMVSDSASSNLIPSTLHASEGAGGFSLAKRLSRFDPA